MFTVFYQIAKNTLRESLREPIFLLMLLSAMVMNGLFPIFTMFVFQAQTKLVIDSTMATTMLFGWGLAILIASYAISREIDDGTALLLLSKPVQRPIFIMAKITGIMAACLVFCVLTSLASLISLRIAADQFRIDMTIMYSYFGAIALAFIAAALYNYITQSSFPMAAVISMLVTIPLVAILGHALPFEGQHVGLPFYILPGLILVIYSVLIMGCLSTALSTRFGLVSNLLLCTCLFLLGLMADFLIGRFTYEKWQDAPAKGKQTLWMSSYSFAPTELSDVGKWEMPVKVDDGETFVVWTDKEKPRHLPALGDNPSAVWNDSDDWKDNFDDVPNAITRMAKYDATLGTWEEIFVANEGAEERLQARDNKKLGASFTSYVFRRSNDTPRTPHGGTFMHPLPSNGSYLASFLYAAIPNWQLFWMADALNNEVKVPASYLAYGAAYTVILVAMLMIIAISLFQNREVGGQMIN